eukprot:4441850-Lingulodinium_polyedra.AAC.1
MSCQPFIVVHISHLGQEESARVPAHPTHTVFVPAQLGKLLLAYLAIMTSNQRNIYLCFGRAICEAPWINVPFIVQTVRDVLDVRISQSARSFTVVGARLAILPEVARIVMPDHCERRDFRVQLGQEEITLGQSLGPNVFFQVQDVALRRASVKPPTPLRASFPDRSLLVRLARRCVQICGRRQRGYKPAAALFAPILLELGSRDCGGGAPSHWSVGVAFLAARHQANVIRLCRWAGLQDPSAAMAHNGL